MSLPTRTLTLSALLLVLTCTSILAEEQRIIAYYPAWAVYERNFWVNDISGSKVTHINYAFFNVRNGKCALGDPWSDLQIPYRDNSGCKGSFCALKKLKEKNPHLRTLLSVGGWTWSGRFSDAARSDESRRIFAESCVKAVKEYGFDGIDIDWEYPVAGGMEGNKHRPEDRENFTKLMAELRKHLDALGGGYALSAASSANPRFIKNLELKKLSTILDWFNVMTYDFNGAWDTSATGFNAPLYGDPANPSENGMSWNVDNALSTYMQNGFPRERINVGVPLYGRGYAGVHKTDNGMYQRATGASKGTWERGVLDWTDLRKNYIGKRGFIDNYNDVAKAAYLYNPNTKEWISYDSPYVVEMKGAYIRNGNFSGAMIWDLSSDRGDELLDALRKGMESGAFPPAPPHPTPAPTEPQPTNPGPEPTNPGPEPTNPGPGPEPTQPHPGCNPCIGEQQPCQHDAVGDNTCYPYYDVQRKLCPPGTHNCA